MLRKRLVSMASPHCAALHVKLLPENWSGRLCVRSALDGTVANRGVKRYYQLESQHLEIIKTAYVDDDKILMQARTVQSRREIALAARTRLTKNGRTHVVAPSREQSERRMGMRAKDRSRR